MSTPPRRFVKIMDNNIRHKTGMAPPHSKLKASGQEISPYPEIIKKKIKKKEKEGRFQFGNAGFVEKK